MSIEGKHAYRFGFLKSEEWKAIRLACLLKNDACCVVCGFRSLENDAHHVRYLGSFWNTKVQQLKTLCRECHTKLHELEKEFGLQPKIKDWFIRCPSNWPDGLCRLCGESKEKVERLEIMCPMSHWRRKLVLCGRCKEAVESSIKVPRPLPGTISHLTKLQSREKRQLTAFTIWHIELSRL